jgi:hypothetical protein
MTRTGVVHRLGSQGSFCFLQTTPGKEVYAHKSVWTEPHLITPGRWVKFEVGPKQPGLRYTATKVEVIPEHPVAS